MYRLYAFKVLLGFNLLYQGHSTQIKTQSNYKNINGCIRILTYILLLFFLIYPLNEYYYYFGIQLCFFFIINQLLCYWIIIIQIIGEKGEYISSNIAFGEDKCFYSFVIHNKAKKRTYTINLLIAIHKI